ncbi:hypothetical protein [Deinococcus frigens]|uniref:hypothetical protein n=1 Tax=Deinococcus frigens TaxID=249403 RepID=UPI000498451A|nr:hypothetical protein [Deinococcus frigens]
MRPATASGNPHAARHQPHDHHQHTLQTSLDQPAPQTKAQIDGSAGACGAADQVFTAPGQGGGFDTETKFKE